MLPHRVLLYQERSRSSSVINKGCSHGLVTRSESARDTFTFKFQNTLHWADRAKEIRTKTCDATDEDVVPVVETETDQAKLVLELQKGNRELRMQLAKLQQKQMILQAQSLAANTSSTPPSATSSLFTPPTSAQTIRKNEA
ncbi:hypothetical protein K1719_007940 [Acacia pycnantha]|nr:hypothetical protein K1719_007940 [Acacia pycnantha]